MRFEVSFDIEAIHLRIHFWHTESRLAMKFEEAWVEESATEKGCLLVETRIDEVVRVPKVSGCQNCGSQLEPSSIDSEG